MKLAPWLIGFLLIGWAVVKMLPPRPTPGFDIDGFARLPVLVGGRVMPMDTLGRLSLLAMNHFGTSTGSDGKVRQPSAWLLEVLMMPKQADTAKVFYVNNPDVLDLAGFSDRKETLFSFNDVKPSLTKIEDQSRLATQVDGETRNPFQRDILKLREALLLYARLKNTVQAEGSPDFEKEVNLFAGIIGPGMQSVRARNEGKPFNQTALKHGIESACIPFAIGMDQAFGVLLAFIASQLVIIGLGLIPYRYWRGIRAQTGCAPSLIPMSGSQLTSSW